MSLKRKLISCIMMFFLIFATLIVGVWAVKSTDFTVGGNISFTAKGINATISAGTLSSTGSWVIESDASAKMKEVVINTQKTEEQLQTEFATWQDLDLLFNENGDDVTIIFSITNNSTKANEYVGVNVSVNGGTMTNATPSISKTSATIAPNSSQEFVITFTVTDKTINASLTGFEISFDLSIVQPVKAEDVSYLTFSYDDTTMTASVSGNSISENMAIEIPSKIINGNTAYDVTNIGNHAFLNCTNLVSIILPDSVTSIGDSAFANCSGLTSITIPDTVISIGDSAFTNCSVTSITIPDSVTSIGNYAFKFCSFTNIIVPDSVVNMGTAVFDYCTNLKYVTLGSGIKLIDNNMFTDCMNLTTITLRSETVVSLSSDVFMLIGCPLSNIYVPSELVASYKTASVWRNYSNIISTIV